ncbi:MAG: YajQ family cyclic di-GMP-binding protein [Acidobacteriota bacterium]|nr:YajQ family cyclic di-GMP-binding protein [Acidobacteriota bacterium]
MAKENSFDITSNVDLNEVSNAAHQTMKEIRQRFDFKGSQSSVKVEEAELVLVSDDEYKLQSVVDILQQKLVKRKVPLKALSYGKIESSLGGTLRQHVALQQGIPSDKTKEIVRFIRDTKLKVRSTIQGDSVRVSGRDRDTLQKIIALVKEKDFGIDIQFTNYRSQ